MRLIFLKPLLCLAALLCIGSTNAQVINALGNESLKIPQTRQNDKSPKTTQDKTAIAEVDTTTAYYALVDSAQRHIAANQWSAAERFLREALKAEPANPNNSLLVSNLATLQRYQGNTADALKNYTLAIDMAPNAVTVLLNRAALLTEIDSLDLALADYSRVIKLDPANEDARFCHGMILLATGNTKQAEDDFNALLRYNPKSVLASEGFGELYKKTGDYSRAVRYLTDVIKVAPRADLLADRADCHLVLQHLAEAADDISMAIQLTPDDPYLYVLRAKLNKLRYAYDDMENDINEAAKRGIDPQQARKMIE